MSTLTSLTNHFRPHRTEAVVRIRQNAFLLLSIMVLTYLLPVPSLGYALRSVLDSGASYTGRRSGFGEADWFEKFFCVFEVVSLAVPSYNILEALYAVKYPRASLPPSHLSPMKKKGIVSTPQSSKKPFSLTSSTSTASKIFSYSPGSSQSLSRSAYLSPLSKSTALDESGYPSSPLSSPSRILRYSMPPGTPASPSKTPNPNSMSTTTMGSTSALPPTPSPVVSAYKGKRGTVGAGRPVDGLFLSQIAHSKTEEQEGEDTTTVPS
ncbi:hypothetical protein K435DRAFT_746403 [Dendrothele bispora CBS 962.96]|uniref:Uncharacterized protein n=1 Tax=Dendrothele bispora (strain CBS 962.96) TaxID=1314807 RepID=A0A4V4HI33_DENBC|nr:hypothetical protein K435DRAFT_746403 [Dendrothele bispora CBS 962.96]